MDEILNLIEPVSEGFHSCSCLSIHSFRHETMLYFVLVTLLMLDHVLKSQNGQDFVMNFCRIVIQNNESKKCDKISRDENHSCNCHFSDVTNA